MSPALRLRRLDALAALLSRSVSASADRWEDALDALLDATPACAAAAFTPELGGLPAAERRLGRAQTERPLDARRALGTISERVLREGRALRLSDVALDAAGIGDTRPLLAIGGRAAFALPAASDKGIFGVVVLLFPDAAMLDEETQRFCASIVELTALACARDRALRTDREQNALSRTLSARSSAPDWEQVLGGATSMLLRQHEELARLAHELGSLADSALLGPVSELGDVVSEMGSALARVQSALGEVSRLSPGHTSASAARRRQRVLVIDDDRSFARAMRRALEPHEVRTAESASEAEMALLDGSYEPHLVLCDVLLPGKNGNLLHARVAEHRPELARRFIFVTGASLASGDAEYLRASGCLTLTKPVDIETLRALIEARVLA